MVEGVFHQCLLIENILYSNKIEQVYADIEVSNYRYVRYSFSSECIL
ncbi:hypothetical protein SpAn4DRAFT_0331 [Sporomusa ovata]|uniref:Uncharacterized protein n=1 Tax=Sporomusa ovata TaxID=2378 RepID=A0A0U1L3G2_9FIRM|nr:hypothetical protein SpAn4DRAFT_0331 [Sporomusa ovata]